MVKPGNPSRMPSPGQLAPTRRMEKGTRTQTLPDRLPFETDGPTTGARHEYQHCWPLWQPNQTAHFPALAITRVSGLTTNPGAKAFAPHLPKTHECRANNAERSGASHASAFRDLLGLGVNAELFGKFRIDPNRLDLPRLQFHF